GIASYLATSERVIRPANSGSEAPGHGLAVVEARNGVAVAVLNLLGQLFLPTPVSPWEMVDKLVEEGRAAAPGVFLDFPAAAPTGGGPRRSSSPASRPDWVTSRRSGTAGARRAITAKG